MERRPSRRLRIGTFRVAADDQIPPPGRPAGWELVSAGVFEQDAGLVSQVLRSAGRPRQVRAIAAGVRESGRVVDAPDGVSDNSQRAR